MNQDRYFTNSSLNKPLTATQGVETRKFSGNPLLREVDEELKRLRSQFDKVASGTPSSTTPTPTTTTPSYSNYSSNYYSNVSSASPHGSRVDDQPRSTYATATDSFQKTFTSGRENYHRDSVRYGANEAVGSTPQGLSSYGYQSNNNSSVGAGYGAGSTTSSGIQSQNVSGSGIQRGSVTTKTATNNGSLEFKSPKNLTSSGRYDVQQVNQVSQPQQPTYQTYNQTSTTQFPSQSLTQPLSQPISQPPPQPSLQPQVQTTTYSQTFSTPQPQPPILSQTFSTSTVPTTTPPATPFIPIIEVTPNQTFKLPPIKPQLVKVSNPPSQTIRINSPPKIRVGPSPSEIQRAQQEARRIAEMQIIEKERELAKQYQQQTTRLREERERATAERREKEEREASISKTELGNYVTNINDKNKKISELESKISQMAYQITNAENEAKRNKLQIESQKNNHRAQVEGLNATIANLKREIDVLNREKDRRNVDLENKINKINFSYEEVNATNNRLTRQIEGLKREVEKKTTTTEVNQNVFEDFKVKINEKTQRINELEKQLDLSNTQRNQLRKRVDELLLQGYEPKKEFSLERLEKQPGAFDEILKLNLEQNQTYKANLSVKNDEIFRLEQVVRTLRGENERMKNEIEIEKLKRMTQLKNTQTTMDIQVQVKQNEINSLNHVIVALQEKLKFIVQEDRKKDQFMVTYLKGRAEAVEEKQSVDEFFKQFELLSVNTNIAECLKREQAEIQRLKDEMQRMYRERR